MPKLTPLQELDAAIRAAATDAEPRDPSRQIAEVFYEEHRELIASVADEWVLEKLTLLIGKHRARMRREANEQLVFEERLGFKRLPRRIETEPGQKVRREDATIGVFRKLASQLRQQHNPALDQANNAIALMSKYTVEEPHITWGEVVRREAAKKSKKTQ